MKKVVLSIIGVVFAAVIIAGVGFSAYLSYKTLQKVEKFESLMKPEESKNGRDEQYVTIGSQYEILDTSAISDAYISGDDSALTDERDKETLKMASDILKELVNDEMSNYEKELAVHDWMAKNLSFDGQSLAAIPNSTELVYKPYGVLKYRNAVCVGYATTFKLFMNMLGMDCIIVHDNELSHSWDLVELEKDEWYYVDVTFDSTSGGVIHSNFNVTQDVFMGSHEFNADGLPLANSTKYGYAVQNAQEEKDIMKMPKKIKEAMDAGESEIYFNIGKVSVEELQRVSAMMSSIADRISMSGEYYAAENSAPGENGTTVIGLTIEKMSDSESTDILGKELEKLLDQLFGSGDMPNMWE